MSQSNMHAQIMGACEVLNLILKIFTWFSRLARSGVLLLLRCYMDFILWILQFRMLPDSNPFSSPPHTLLIDVNLVYLIIFCSFSDFLVVCNLFECLTPLSTPPHAPSPSPQPPPLLQNVLLCLPIHLIPPPPSLFLGCCTYLAQTDLPPFGRSGPGSLLWG